MAMLNNQRVCISACTHVLSNAIIDEIHMIEALTFAAALTAAVHLPRRRFIAALSTATLIRRQKHWTCLGEEILYIYMCIALLDKFKHHFQSMSNIISCVLMFIITNEYLLCVGPAFPVKPWDKRITSE